MNRIRFWVENSGNFTEKLCTRISFNNKRKSLDQFQFDKKRRRGKALKCFWISQNKSEKINQSINLTAAVSFKPEFNAQCYLKPHEYESLKKVFCCVLLKFRVKAISESMHLVLHGVAFFRRGLSQMPRLLHALLPHGLAPRWLGNRREKIRRYDGESRQCHQWKRQQRRRSARTWRPQDFSGHLDILLDD